MKQVIAAIFLLFATTTAFANCDNINVPGLSDSKIAELKLQCQQALVDASKTTLPSVGGVEPEKLSAYGVVAQEWAKAIGIAANELGVAANTFLGTDAGKLTAGIIIFHMFGEQIIGAAIGIPLLILTLWVGLSLAKRSRIESIEYDEEKTDWRGRPKVKKINLVDIDSNQASMYWVAHIVTLILCFWIVAGIIF